MPTIHEIEKSIEETFPKGSLVRVKDHKVPMTVERIDGRNVCCVWFDKGQALQRHAFDAALLVPAR